MHISRWKTQRSESPRRRGQGSARRQALSLSLRTMPLVAFIGPTSSGSDQKRQNGTPRVFLPIPASAVAPGRRGENAKKQSAVSFPKGRKRTSGASVTDAEAVAVALAFALVAAVTVAVTITVEFTVAIAGAHPLRRCLSMVLSGQGKELEKPVRALHTSGAPGMMVASFDGFGNKMYPLARSSRSWRQVSTLAIHPRFGRQMADFTPKYYASVVFRHP